MIPQTSKKPRASMDSLQFSLSDRQAIERVALMLNKPVSELMGEASQASRGLEYATRRGPIDMPQSTDMDQTVPFHSRVGAASQESTHHWEHGQKDIDTSLTSHLLPPGSWSKTDDPHRNDAYDFSYTHAYPSHIQAEEETYIAPFGGFEPDIGFAGTWSNDVLSNEAVNEFNDEFNVTANHKDNNGNRNLELPLDSLKHVQHDLNLAGEAQNYPFSTFFQGQTMDTTDLGSNDRIFSSSSDDLADSVESDSRLEPDQFELLTRHEAPSTSSEVLATSAGTTNSGWSLIDMAKEHESPRGKPFNVEKASSAFVRWIDPGSEQLSTKKRRGPFQDKQLQEETSETRRRKACVRCRQQKTRCIINPNDRDGVCLTCQAVSKQKIHTLPCLRYKITECVLYRTGKAPGMEFTFRWPVMKLKDISQWANTEVRTISIKSDVCPTPFNVSVRRFVPIPQDSLCKGWMDGKTKKFKEVTPFAIVNMSAAVKDLWEHINTYVFQCMSFCLKGKDALITETYTFARQYMTNAPDDEKKLLSSFFRLWFAIRRTATTEEIVGDDTIDMAPETKDPSYPLFGKVPLPPVMIQQLDMILTLGLLQPLRKKVLEGFSKLINANKPKSWITIYLMTFMFTHSCASLSDENFQNARKHGLRRRYAMPTFISELHNASNVMLAHYHYRTEPCNPFKIDWRRRQSTQFAEMSTDEIHFIMKTSEMVEERRDKFRRTKEVDLYEDDLYFTAQMFEQDWSPRDTVIDYDGGTIGDVDLKRYYKKGTL